MAEPQGDSSTPPHIQMAAASAPPSTVPASTAASGRSQQGPQRLSHGRQHQAAAHAARARRARCRSPDASRPTAAATTTGQAATTSASDDAAPCRQPPQRARAQRERAEQQRARQPEAGERAGRDAGGARWPARAPGACAASHQAAAAAASCEPEQQAEAAGAGGHSCRFRHRHEQPGRGVGRRVGDGVELQRPQHGVAAMRRAGQRGARGVVGRWMSPSRRNVAERPGSSAGRSCTVPPRPERAGGPGERAPVAHLDATAVERCDRDARASRGNCPRSRAPRARTGARRSPRRRVARGRRPRRAARGAGDRRSAAARGRPAPAPRGARARWRTTSARPGTGRPGSRARPRPRPRVEAAAPTHAGARRGLPLASTGTSSSTAGEAVKVTARAAMPKNVTSTATIRGHVAASGRSRAARSAAEGAVAAGTASESCSCRERRGNRLAAHQHARAAARRALEHAPRAGIGRHQRDAPAGRGVPDQRTELPWLERAAASAASSDERVDARVGGGVARQVGGDERDRVEALETRGLCAREAHAEQRRFGQREGVLAPLARRAVELDRDLEGSRRTPPAPRAAASRLRRGPPAYARTPDRRRSRRCRGRRRRPGRARRSRSRGRAGSSRPRPASARPAVPLPHPARPQSASASSGSRRPRNPVSLQRVLEGDHGPRRDELRLVLPPLVRVLVDPASRPAACRLTSFCASSLRQLCFWPLPSVNSSSP